MGTPDFAVSTLKMLINNNIEVAAVVTAPDKPANRGLKLSPSAVKLCALQHQIPVLQPQKLKNPEFVAELKNLNANLFIVVAFRMLPEIIFTMPPLGTINLHASLLPKYRGAAPINWAIMNGETETGVTTFFIEKEIDTGKLILQEKVSIGKTENFGSLYDRLKNIGANLVLQTVKAIQNKNYLQIPQQWSEQLPTAPKIFTQTCKINWNNTTEQVYNQIRGLSPVPGAFTYFKNKLCKIYDAQPILSLNTLSPETYQSDNKTYWHIATSDGFISIKELQLESKKRTSIEEFLKGNKVM